MNKFYTILSSFIFAFSAMGMAADYTAPTYYCDKGKEFDKLTLRYATEMTLTCAGNSDAWQHNGDRIFYNVLSDFTINAKAGETIVANFKANNPDYDSKNSEDLRWTIATLHIDWDRDGTFESSEIIAGRTGAQIGSGNDDQRYYGNREVIFDITKNIVVPDGTTPGKVRVRLNYTNAWIYDDPVSAFATKCKEGIVYDFDVNIVPTVVQNHVVTVTPNEHAQISLLKGTETVASGSEVPEGTELTVNVVPDDGWKITSIKANEVNITDSRTFVVNGATTVSVEVSEIKYGVVTYSIVGDQSYLGEGGIELYDGESNIVNSGVKLEEGSFYYIIIYTKDDEVKVSVTLNGNPAEITDDVNMFYYEGIVEGDQNLVITLPGGTSGLEPVVEAIAHYNPGQQMLCTNGSSVLIYDLSGRLLLSGSGNVSVSELADGFYAAVVDGRTIKFKK